MRPISVLLALVLALLVAASPARADFGFADLDVTVTDSSGQPATLAGSHPREIEVEIDFNLQAGPGGPISEGDVKDLEIALPPGLIENPTVAPTCSQADFHSPRSSPYGPSDSGEDCPAESQIGTIAVRSGGDERHFGLFNLSPPPGSPSRFGAAPFGAPVLFVPRVRQAEGEFGLTLATRNFSQLVDLTGVDLTIWGVPSATSHDGQRGDCLNESAPGSPHAQCPMPPGNPLWSYLTLPSDCSRPLVFSVSADSWSDPGAYLPSADPDLSDLAWRHAEIQSGPALTDCAGLAFFAVASVVPTTALVSSPTGLSFRLDTNQAALKSPTGRLASRIKQATVALPEGMTINPSVGAGLDACTPAQFAAESVSSLPGTGCPNPSKIGTITLQTPLLEGEALSGSLFIAKPFDNPFGSAYALYFVAKSPERGFLVKVAGRLDADPATGRLTATFENLPQLPYTNLSVNFREGQRAPLVSPTSCGFHTAQVSLRPWSDPSAVLSQTSSFPLVRGITPGGSCPQPGTEPFAPAAYAGTLNPISGAYTPFYLRLTRADYEQEITTYSTVLPPGLLGRIAGVPFCSDAAIEGARHRTGTAELLSPSCPSASQIGHTVSGYGVGLAPAYAPGKLYLAGPFQGRPLSLVAINSAIVGPFDLGTVVIRSAIDVDPRTARVSLDAANSDPIPHIFAGIPLHLRDIRVYLDRPDFMVNPTSCAPFQISSTLTGSRAPFLNPKDTLASSAVPFQASGCPERGFAPRFGLSLSGASKRGAYPRLRAVFTPRPGDANLAAAAVTLPPSLFLAQEHIAAICTRVQMAADACPPAAAVGRAVAQTPLLSESMEGPVYLRSSDHVLPDLVAVLQGRGVRILVEGRVDSYRGGIRSTFEGLPDAPLSQFSMTIFGGKKKGILVNAENLCRSTQFVNGRFVSQSNRSAVLKPKIAVRCAKKHAKAKGRGK